MSLMNVMLKDITVLVGLAMEHWIHKTFVQIKIDIFGKTRSRTAQMKNLKKREVFLVDALQTSIYSMREYRALVKAGYDPSQ